MEERRLGWRDGAQGREGDAFDHDSGHLGGLLPVPRQTPDDAGGERAAAEPVPPVFPAGANGLATSRDLEPAGLMPVLVDRRELVRSMNQVLEIDPRRTAVITIDCHRGHLDLAVATMPLAPQAAASLVGETARLLRFARACGMSVIHVLTQNRILPHGQPEVLCNPFWAAVESTRQVLTPGRESTISRHNLVGTVQTQLMPELGPEPGDVTVDRKRRLSIFRDTDLDLTLRELGVDTVVLAGISTNTDVLCAAFESQNRDLQTIVVSDCVRSVHGDDLHFFALQDVARCLGWVLTLEELAAKVGAGRAAAIR